MRKRYIVYVTRDEKGVVDRVAIPMRFVYVFVLSAVMGMFTIAGMAGSYTRMLAKTESFNKLRDELAMTRRDYAHLEKKEHEKDVQAASLGSLASEVSAIYGLTAGKLSLPHRQPKVPAGAAAAVAKAQLKDDANFTDDSYYKSLDTFVALQQTAEQGLSLPTSGFDRGFGSPLGMGSPLSSFGSMTAGISSENMPDMWPILGPINSGFGEREDPVLGNGEGEFHKGVDIGSPDGTPVHAPADGKVMMAGMGSGYGREIEIDHGNGIVTVYGHLQGWNVVAGQMVVKGQVIGFVGHSGRTTGSHLHYEVRVRGSAVNPHRYLQTTMAQLGAEPTAAGDAAKDSKAVSQ